MKQRGLIAIMFVLGCATGGVAAQLVVPQARAGTNPVRWEYFCARIAEGALTAELNKMGAAGWELTTTIPVEQEARFSRINIMSFGVCAKRALP